MKTCENRDEPAPGIYALCGGCGRVYLTPEDLQAAYVSRATDIDPAVAKVAPPVERIHFCPYCLGDI